MLIDFDANEVPCPPSANASAATGIVIERDFREARSVPDDAGRAESRFAGRPAAPTGAGLRPELACFFALAKKPGRTVGRPVRSGILAELAQGHRGE